MCVHTCLMKGKIKNLARYGKNGHLRSESLGPFYPVSVFFSGDVCV
jgi:hypothetical protein